MNKQRGPWYEEMTILYDKFVKGNLDYHYTNYFTELKKYYKEGSLITRIHALEMILNLILGGKWTGGGSTPNNIAHHTQNQMMLHLEGQGHDQKEIAYDTVLKHSEVKNEKGVKNHSFHKKIHLIEIIEWLETALPNEENEHVVKVYFIFIKTHWEQLYVENPYFSKLYKLHKELLHKKEYGKLELLEQLNKNAFSKRYKILK